jgi:uncharacterized protein YukE
MAARYDVAGRLAEGQPAVDDMQTYVSAGQARGFVNADLTLHSGQVHEWYGTEDGLNLHLLDADCAALRAVAQTAEEALRAVRDQTAALEHAWTGTGGGAAAEFVRRHSSAGAEVAAALRRAAEAYATLRDQLWDVVDRRVNATLTIDDRTRSQRPGWLTASHAVLAGAQDDTSAEVIDTQVKPFVDNGIRGEWVPAMRSAAADAVTAYRVATDAVGPRAGVRFEVPGDLGPRFVAPPVSAAAPVAPMAVRPASVTAVEDSWPVDGAPAAMESAPVSAPPPLPPAPAPALAAPLPVPPPPAELPTSAPGLGSLPSLGGGGSGGGLPDMGGLLGDLFSGPTDAPVLDPLPDSLPDNDINETDPDEPDEDTEDAEDTDDTEDTEDTEDVDDPEVEEPAPTDVTAEEAVDDCPPESEDEPPTPEPVAAPAPAGPPAAPVAAPVAGETPCEIAADELPQVGQ